MSEIETLKTENENLKQQLMQNSNGVTTLLAQVDAHKGMLNECLATSLQLRTNLLLFQKSAKEWQEKANELQKLLDAANAKIAELEKGVTDATNPQP